LGDFLEQLDGGNATAVPGTATDDHDDRRALVGPLGQPAEYPAHRQHVVAEVNRALRVDRGDVALPVGG